MNNIDAKSLSVILKSRGLSFSAELVKDQINRKLHRVVLPVTDGKADMIFKLLLQNEQEFKGRFLTEVEILKVLKNKHFEHKILINNLIQFGNNPSPWFLATKVPGITGGNIFDFDRKYVNQNLISTLIEFFGVLANSNKDISKFAATGENKAFITRNLKLFNFPFLIQYQPIVAVLGEQVKLRNSLTLSHSDLTPLNCLFSVKGIGVIDWESVSLRDKVFDPAYVYHRLWRVPVWQRKYKKAIFEDYLSREDLDAFNFYLLLLLAIDIQTINSLLEKGENRLYQDKTTYSKEYMQEKSSMYLQKIEEICKDYLK